MENCTKIVQLVADHKERRLKDKGGAVATKGLWMAAKFVLGKIVGKAGGPILELLKPTRLGTGVDGYYGTLNKFITAVEDGADSERLLPLVETLKYYEDHIRIEKEFGIKSNCYESLQAITNDAEEYANAPSPPVVLP